MINKPKLLVKVAQECLKGKRSLAKIKFKKKIPWPLAFVQYCIKEVDKQTDQEELMGNVADDEGFAGTFSPSYGHSSIFEFHDCLDIWENIEKKFKLKKPTPGSLVIWERKDGPCLICVVIKILEGDRIQVIEGLDSSNQKIVKKGRSLRKEKDLALIGIITPWH